MTLGMRTTIMRINGILNQANIFLDRNNGH
jgi:hypothetical protein